VACLVAFLGIWSTGVLSYAGTDGQSLRERFTTEAPKEWEEYEKTAASFQGVATLIIDSGNGKPLKSSVHYKSNQHCRLMISHAGPEVPIKVFAFNPKYSFVLTRDKEDFPWIIEDLRKAQEGRLALVQEEIGAAIGINSILVYPHYRLLSELVRQPTFAVRKVSSVRTDGHELVRVDFDNAHPLDTDPKKFFPVQNGSLVLDPARSWCIRSATLQSKYRGTDIRSTIVTEMDDLGTKYPLPKKYVEQREMSAEGQDVKKSIKHIREFELQIGNALPPEEEFTLSAFGLSEPTGVEWNRPIPVFLWIVGGAVCVLVLGTLVSWLKRRLSR
jgi:hypothetical protein